jgi:threonine synthase
MSPNNPTDLQCPECGAEYEAGPDEPWRCECGHPLEFSRRPIPNGSPPPFSRLDTSKGQWTFFETLPVSRQVTLGEGFTPLVEAPNWNAQFKLEYVMPTGSFKDRGASTVLSRAVELGVEKVIEDSSGNAGAAIATYAARAGLEADIYVPDDVESSKLMAIQRTGARPVRIEGDREDVAQACIEAVEDGEGWYASHAWNPAFFAGMETFAMELAAQRDWEVPDALVIPVGHGTLLLGAYRGFSVLERAGIVDEVPRLLAVQAKGYAPIAEEFEDARPDEEEEDELGKITIETGSSMHEEAETNEVADAVHIRNPVRESQIVDAIWSTGGDAIAMPENPVELALDELHRAGLYVEPTCALGVAAMEEFRREGILDASDDVVVPLTGSGLKTL